MKLSHKFVDLVPNALDEGVLYVCIKYKTVSHLCCCGCGHEVVTPLAPTFWKLTFDGDTVSLSPSVGNWEFPCRSHYWVRENRMEWSDDWTEEQIAAADARDCEAKARYYQGRKAEGTSPALGNPAQAEKGWWVRFKRRWMK